MLSPSSAFQTQHDLASRTPVYRAAFARNYKSEIMSSSPSLYLRLGESSGATADDESGNNLDGAYQNTPTYSVDAELYGDTNTAVRLNGTDEYITVADNALLDPGDTFSIVLRVRLTNLAANQALLDKGTNGYQLIVDTAGTLYLTKTGTANICSNLSAQNMVPNRWYHIAVTKATSTFHIYIDGVESTSSIGNQTIAGTASSLNIGRLVAGTSYLAGAIDEVALFPTALSAVRVTALYRASVGRKVTTHKLCDYYSEVRTDAPTGYWRLGETSGTAAADSSGNGLSGVYQNTPTLGATGALSGSSAKSVTLNGTDEYITVADTGVLDLGTDTLALEILAYFDSVAAGVDPLFDKGTAGYYLYRSGTSLVFAKKGTGDIVASSVALSAGAWYHIAVTKSGASSTKMYLNGVDVTGSVTDRTIAGTADSLYIGQDSGGTAWHAGSLQEAAVYPTALSAARILAHYTATLCLQNLSTWLPYMQLPRGIAAFIEPEQGRSSVGSIVLPITDLDGYVTEMVSGEGCASDVATIEMGFAGIQGEEFEAILTGRVEACKMAQDLAGYEITVRDPQSLTNRSVFDVAASPLAVALTDAATTAYIIDSSSFLSSGYARIDNELVSYSGKVNSGVQPSNVSWRGVAYGGSTFVGVAATGTNRVATSTDGATWVMRSASEQNAWEDVCYATSLGLFVAVSSTGTNRVMTSPDGITWTARSAAAAASWSAVAWSETSTLLVAVASTGEVMSSADGITWTSRTPSTAGQQWLDVVFGDSTLGWIAVGGGSTDYVMTSPDAITWTARTAASARVWAGVDFSSSLGLFVAVGLTGGAGNYIMTSPTGATWTSRTESSAGDWRDVAWSATANVWVASAYNGGNKFMYSVNGTTGWTAGTSAADDTAVLAYGSDKFVALGQSATNGITAQKSTDGITWTATYASLTGLTRGVDLLSTSTVAAAHSAGASVREVLYLTSDHPMDTLVGVYGNTDKTGLSIPIARIDFTTIIAVRSSIGDSYLTGWLIEARQNAKQWIEQEICKPLGLYPVTTGSGELSVVRFAAPSGAVETIDHDSILAGEDGRPVLTWDANVESIINAIVFEHDHDIISGDFLAATEVLDQDSIDRHGRRSVTIQCKGLHLALAGTSALIAAVATTIMNRYKDGAPLVTCRTFLKNCLIEAGDIVELTSDLLPDKATGVRGVTTELMEVVGAEILFAQGQVDLKLLNTGWNQ